MTKGWPDDEFAEGGDNVENFGEKFPDRFCFLVQETPENESHQILKNLDLVH